VFYKVRGEAAGDDPSAAAAPKSTAPKHQACQTKPEVEAVALEIRAQLINDGWDGGPISVAAKMVAMGFTPPSRATLARIFTRNGVVTPQPQKRPRASYRRFVYPDPNGCWQLDGMEFKLDTGLKRCIMQVEDDHSRVILESLVAVSENSRAAVLVVSRAIGRHGPPQFFLTDNSKAFNQSRSGGESALEKYLRLQGVKPISGRPNKPTTQGKNERLHQTLRQFLEAHRPINTTTQLQALVDTFADYYNTCRPHQALNGQTPADAYQAKPKAQPSQQPLPLPDTIIRRRQPGETSIDDSPTAARWADRKADATGRIYICNTGIYIGIHHAKQTFHIMFDLATITIFDADGTFIGQVPRPTSPARTSRTLRPRQTTKTGETQPSTN